MASARRAQRKTKKKKATKLAPIADPRLVHIEPMDPWLTCGPDTSVQELWRVKESVGKATTFHLVFFDKYGWYCEHGRGCPAVTDVRRLIREIDGR